MGAMRASARHASINSPPAIGTHMGDVGMPIMANTMIVFQSICLAMFIGSLSSL